MSDSNNVVREVRKAFLPRGFDKKRFERRGWDDLDMCREEIVGMLGNKWNMEQPGKRKSGRKSEPLPDILLQSNHHLQQA